MNLLPSTKQYPPFVSILIPVLNADNTIGQVIQKVFDQTYSPDNYEIIVIDNGSCDKTVRIITEYPVKLIYETTSPNSYLARNRGLANARGEIIAFIDADCFPEREWLETLVKPFHNDRIGVVAGEVLSYLPNNHIQAFYEFSGLLEQRLKVEGDNPAIATANVAIRKQIFDIVGKFDDNFRWGGDNDFGRRIQNNTDYRITFEPDAIVYHFHRKSFKAFMKHAYTYGLGKGRFELKYTTTNKNTIFIRAFCTLLRLLAGIPLIPLRAYTIYKSGRTFSESAVFPLLDKLFCVVDQIGKLIFIVTKNDIFFRKAQWPSVN